MKKIIALLVAYFSLSHLNSQVVAPSVMNTAGGTVRSGYYQFEWSIGELAIVGDMTGLNGSIVFTNGFIQSHIQYPSGNNADANFGNDEIKIFPNPASTYVEINFFTKQKGRLTTSFYDAAGKKVYTATDVYYGVGFIKRIPVSQLPNEVYMIHIDLDPFPGYTAKKGAYKIIKVK